METLTIKTFSPREFAEVVGVSESSIKRWVDDGRIEVTRTAGGHRRIALREALHFIREQEMQVLRPDLLGLPDLEGLAPEAREGRLTGEALAQLLTRGEVGRARGLIAARYMAGVSLAALCDGPIAEALDELGEMGLHDAHGIYVEHLATNTCIEAVNQVRLLMPPPGRGAPLALGGAPEADPYVLPSLMAAAVLAEAGFDVVNLGPHVPKASFLHAVEAHSPDLVWVAATAGLEGRGFGEMRELGEELARRGIPVVLGGRAAVAREAHWPEAFRVLGSMQELAAYAAEHRRT